MNPSPRQGNPRTYRGVKMRSHAEARVACFLDYRDTAWKYEPERIGPLAYLPDFYLPDFDTYIEVKPPNVSFAELAIFYLTAERLEPPKTFVLFYVNKSFQYHIWDAYSDTLPKQYNSDQEGWLWASSRVDVPKINLPWIGGLAPAGQLAKLAFNFPPQK